MTFSREIYKITSSSSNLQLELECSLENIVPEYLGVKNWYRLIIVNNSL